MRIAVSRDFIVKLWFNSMQVVCCQHSKHIPASLYMWCVTQKKSAHPWRRLAVRPWRYTTNYTSL